MAMKLVDTEQLESDLTSVADSIRAKTGGADALAFPSGFVSAVEGIESADSALDEVEYALSNGYTDYGRYFYYKTWMEEAPMEILQHTENGLTFYRAFENCSSLEEVGILNTGKSTSFFYMFKGCKKLKTIGGIDLTNSYTGSGTGGTTYIFHECSSLEYITFNGYIKETGLDLSPCSKLTHDSLMSAINALYDYASEGSTSTYTLTLGSTNLAKLTDAEKAIATQRGWTLA